jgi:hypothetical protein
MSRRDSVAQGIEASHQNEAVTALLIDSGVRRSRLPGRQRWRFTVQLGLPPRPVVNHLMAPVVGHLLPRPNFVERPKTPDAKLGLAIEGTDIDARRLDCHGSGCRV